MHMRHGAYHNALRHRSTRVHRTSATARRWRWWRRWRRVHWTRRLRMHTAVRVHRTRWRMSMETTPRDEDVAMWWRPIRRLWSEFPSANCVGARERRLGTIGRIGNELDSTWRWAGWSIGWGFGGFLSVLGSGWRRQKIRGFVLKNFIRGAIGKSSRIPLILRRT